MLIKGLDAGVSEHELADAGILLRELGAHQAPQVMWLDIRQPDPDRIPLDDLPGTLTGEWFCREPSVCVLSTTVKAGEDVGRLDGAGGEPGLDGSVGLPGQGDVAVLRLVFPPHLDDVALSTRAEPVARDVTDLRDARPVAEGMQQGQVPQPEQAARVGLFGELAHLLWGDFDACIGFEAVFEPLDGDAAHAVELLERAWGNELFLLGLHHHVPDGGEHAVDRVGGELLPQHLPGAFPIGDQVDALHQVCAPLREDRGIERRVGVPCEAQVIEKILGVLLAGRVGDLASQDAVVPAE